MKLERERKEENRARKQTSPALAPASIHLMGCPGPGVPVGVPVYSQACPALELHFSHSMQISYHEQCALPDLSGNGLRASGALVVLIPPYCNGNSSGTNSNC